MVRSQEMHSWSCGGQRERSWNEQLGVEGSEREVTGCTTGCVGGGGQREVTGCTARDPASISDVGELERKTSINLGPSHICARVYAYVCATGTHICVHMYTHHTHVHTQHIMQKDKIR